MQPGVHSLNKHLLDTWIIGLNAREVKMTKTMSAQGVQSRRGDKHIKHVIAVYGLGRAMAQLCRSIREHRGEVEPEEHCL